MKIRSKSSILIGALLALLIILSNRISLSMCCMLLISVLFILDGIFYHKAGILSILIGFAILTSVFIWLITQNINLYSFEVLLGIIIGIVMLIWGTMVYSGHLSEKSMRGNLD